MAEHDVQAQRERALAALSEAALAAGAASDAESALRYLTAATREVLGDREAHLRPGGLGKGERQFMVSGVFLITPDRRHNLLVAEHGFPPQQHRLRIPIDLGHPGWVVKHQRALILANTDKAPDFRQILKTSRMGSALYGPMFWRGHMLGQFITAAQARNTYGPVDLDILVCFAHVAAAVYMAHGGPEFLRSSDEGRGRHAGRTLGSPARPPHLAGRRDRGRRGRAGAGRAHAHRRSWGGRPTMSGYFDEVQHQRMLAEYPLGQAFLDGIARASRDEVRALQERRFQTAFARAWQIPFYRRLWGARGLEPGDMA